MNILILSHERSLNKAEGLLRAYANDNCILVVDHLPNNNQKSYIKYAKRVVVNKSFNLTYITKEINKCDTIHCVSENLLPIQSQLESYYGIDNLTPFAAEVLSNKQLFDNFCSNIGLAEYVPKSITPTFHNHLDIFNNKEFFTKPDIGTGSNVFFPGSDQNTPNIEYRRWNNKHHFLKHLKDKESHNDFFMLNKQGIHAERFNFKPCRIMAQQYHWSEEPTVAPYGYIRNGKVEILFYVKCSKINFGETIDPLSNPINSHRSSRLSDIGRERAVWITMPEEVDKNFHQQSLYFLNTLIKNLKIKNMFFAGPDFHITNNSMKAIDFNPRPGQFINLLNKVNNYKIIKQVLDNKDIQIDKKAMYACPILKPGIIKEVKNIESIKHLLTDEYTNLKPGLEIPKFQHLFNKSLDLTLYIDGNNEQELFENYKQANQLLQNCITY